ncbi:MAG: methyltransferase domain-containing protein [Sedimentitalea sp.]
MTQPPALFDRPSLDQRRRRMRGDALFLHETALEEVQDRLAGVKRAFTSVAIVTPCRDLWRNAFPEATFAPDHDTLDLALGQFDLVIHAMCLHWANDPVGQLIQCRRALVEDGLLLLVALGGHTLHELRTSLATGETQATSGLSPRVAPMAEIRDMGALLQRAGLTLPVADSFQLNAQYRDLTHLMHDLRHMGETNVLTNRLRRPTRRSVFEAAEKAYRSAFSQDGTSLTATFEIICLTGWSPSDSQPKALRPGSAKTRLSDALGTSETKLSD